MNNETVPFQLARTVQAHPDRIALTFLRRGEEETRLTFAGLLDDINVLAAELITHGVSRGDRVVIFLPKSVFAVVAHFAVQAIGAISVPLNPGFTKNEMSYLLEDSSPKLIIAEPEKDSFIRETYPEGTIYQQPATEKYRGFKRAAVDTLQPLGLAVTPDDPALIIYTSGTTGNPKGAVLSHRNLLADARNITAVWEISAADTVCHSLPLFHVHGLCFALQTPLLAGARINLLDTFNPEIVAAELSSRTGEAMSSVFMAVPAMYTKLLDYLEGRQLDFSHLRLITSGSAPLPVREFATDHEPVRPGTRGA